MASIRALMMGTVFAAAIAAAPSTSAQQAEPHFRVPIGGSQAPSSGPPVYAWLESISECSSTCGPGTRTTSHQCQNAADFDYSGGGYGAPETDSLCTASVGPKPSPATSSCTNYSGCGYDWVKPPVEQTPKPFEGNPVVRVGCGWVQMVFSPYCQRTGGASPVVMPASDHRFCRNDTPDYDQVAAGHPDALGYDRMETQLGSCNASDHDWRTGGWGSFDSTCSNTATQTRSVTCHRRFDDKAVDDGRCDTASKPASSRTQGVYSSCTFDWVGGGDGDWGAWSSTCSTTATRTRNPRCRRSDGDIVADASCVDAGKAKPSSSDTAPVYTGCTYAAGGTTTNGAWSSTCSANASRTVTRQCIRSNGDMVADSECTSRGTSLTSSQTQAVYDECSYAFETGAWGAWSSNCSSSASRTRPVTCRRSDGTTVADSECTGRGVARPGSSETQAVYEGCSYSPGGSTSYGPWSSTCSANATRSVTRQCIRSNGDVVADAECTSRGIGISSTQTAAIYDGCGYSYAAGGWSAWSSTCSSSAARTRSVSCQRGDGSTVADSECASRGVARPPSTETAAVYDSCSYARGDRTGTSDWNSHCSANASRTHYHNCRRSDGAVVADAECTGRGISLTVSEGGAVYDGCGYSYQSGAWSSWSSGCSSSATRTRPVWCQRSDGATVADAECSNRGIGRPTSSETGANYSSCTYSTSYEPFSACSNGSQTRNVTCTRSDGARVDPSMCGQPATQTQACTPPGATVNDGSLTGGDGSDYVVVRPGPFNQSSTSFYQAGTLNLGNGNGNYDYDGFTCSYSVTITYGGQSGTLSSTGYNNPAGSCYGGASSIVLAGRRFDAGMTISSRGYGVAEYNISISAR